MEDNPGWGFDPDSPEYNSWYTSLIDSISGWFGGILEGLVLPFESLALGINQVRDLILDFPSVIKGEFSDLFSYLFVPPEDFVAPWSELRIKEKFTIFEQLSNLLKVTFQNPNIIDRFSPPSFSIIYKGKEMEIIDFSVYEPYRLIVHSIILALAYLRFSLRTIKRINIIIKGV